MLKKNEFKVLLALKEAGCQLSQREISKRAGIAVGSVNSTLKHLGAARLIDDAGSLTAAGRDALEDHHVSNAIILAAGLSSRFAPISYEKPKGLLKVRGEVLIERQIKQLQEAGISDIIVVVGYKKEHFFYLEDTLGVKIVVNEEFSERNNNSSLMAIREKLGNTYVCSSDDYFTENPFTPYVWKAYYAAQYSEGPTREWCMTAGPGKRIVDVKIGGADAWYMVGHVYFDKAFSKHFVEILENEYNLPETAGKLWEQLYIDHIDEFDMVMKEYPADAIHEFDSLDEVRAFDPLFLENVDSEVFDNIVSVLHCEKNDIHDVYPLNQGLTNLSCHFMAGDDEYVYRHPGVGTEELIDRNAEMIAQSVAYKLGLDDTYIYENPQKGWKISRFIPNCRQLDPHSPEELARAMRMARQLHEQTITVDRHFDFYEESLRYERLMGGRAVLNEVAGFAEMADIARRLKEHTDADGAPVCLTHNDFFYLNFLIDEAGEYYLIDWEYSGMSDYASDFGTFVVCCELSHEEALQALEDYFGRTPTDAEIRHNFAYVAFAGWCWYLWSLYKESQGEHVGEWLYIYYRYAKRYLKRVLGWYESDTAGE